MSIKSCGRNHLIAFLVMLLSLSIAQIAIAQTDCNANGIIDANEFDGDGDGIINACDNCSRTANSSQLDTDTDGFGNICDADLDNSGYVTFLDLALFRSAFNSPDIHADFDGSGYVTLMDLATFRLLFNRPPGPGPNSNDADSDLDGVLNAEDNCPAIANSDQLDRDTDGDGDACDATPIGAGGLSLENYGVSGEEPSVLAFMMRAVDRTSGVSVALLGSDLQVREDDNTVSPSEAFLQVKQFHQLANTQLDTIILIDIGRSINADYFPLIRAAAKHTIRDPFTGVSKLLENQRVAIYSFNGELVEIQTFTKDVELLEAAIDSIDRGGLATNLYGALYDALDDWDNVFSLEQQSNFGAMILVTDGQDTADLFQLEDVLPLAATRAIYSIAVGPEADVDTLTLLSKELLVIDSYDYIQPAFNTAMAWVWNIYNKLEVVLLASSKRANEHSLSMNIINNPPCLPTEIHCSTEISGTFNADGFSDVNPDLQVLSEIMPNPGDIDIWQAETLWSDDPANFSWVLENHYNNVTMAVSADTTSATVTVPLGSEFTLAEITITDLNYPELVYQTGVRTGNGLIVKNGDDIVSNLDMGWEQASLANLRVELAEPTGMEPAFEWSLDDEDAAMINATHALNEETLQLFRSPPTAPLATSNLTVTDTASGFSHTIVISNNSYFVPYPDNISAGELHGCAFYQDELMCWGNNDYGQTDVPYNIDSQPLSNLVTYSAGQLHTCALDDNGVLCWGENGYGQTDVPELAAPTDVTTGDLNSCVIDNNNVRCWGFGGLGQNTIPELSNPRSISAGGLHICALDDNGVKCWGYNNDGQTDVPETLINPSMVTAGFKHSCALDDNGVSCWGLNSDGQTNVQTLTNPVAVSAGESFTCALADEGILCWGNNTYGQLNVPDLNNPSQIIAGYQHACAEDDNGLHCWGFNDDGQASLLPIWGWQ